MNKQDKPRICEVLGVEVDERFTIKSDDDRICNNMYKGCEMFVDADGDVNFATKKLVNAPGVEKVQHKTTMLLYAINHPECIVRRKRFTEQEREDAKAIKRILPNMRAVRRNGVGALCISGDRCECLSFLANTLFPSIGPNESYTLDEIIGEG